MSFGMSTNGPDTIIGWQYNEEIARLQTRDVGADSISGLGGNDTLWGWGGNDTLLGGTGFDQLHGGDGDNVLIPGAGRAYVTSGTGADTIIASPDDTSHIYAGDGADSINGQAAVMGFVASGEAGNDTILGGQSDDELYGGLGKDFLSGGLGDDEIWDGGGSEEDNDTILGGGGDDVLRISAGSDWINGGAGQDTLYLDYAWTASSLLFKSNDILSDPGEPEIRVLRLIGGSGAVTEITNVEMFVVEGGRTADVLGGGAFDDTLRGNGGDDIIGGNAGDDRVFGGNGADTLSGGAGYDVVHGEDGDDLIDLRDDILSSPGTYQGGRAHGDAGNDTIIGGNHDGELSGDDGDDVISGGFSSHRGRSVLGGSGNDLLFGADAGNGGDVLAGGDGADTIRSGSGGNGYNERLFGRVGGGLLGEAGDDLLIGGDGSQLIYGGLGNDWLEGGGGDDLLNDYEFFSNANADLPRRDPAGADTILGGEGDDIIVLTGGADHVVGGAGKDILRMDWSGSSAPVLFDFRDAAQRLVMPDTGASIIGVEQFELSGSDGADTLLAGNPEDPLNGYFAPNPDHANTDWLRGGAGDDVLTLRAGGIAHGGMGADTLTGGASPAGLHLEERLHGEDGDDLILTAGVGLEQTGNTWEFAYGGDGADTIVAGPHIVLSTLDGGAGSDLLLMGIALQGPGFSGGFPGSALGQAGDDTIIGQAGRHFMMGGDGADSMDGGGGDDWLLDNDFQRSALPGAADTLRGGDGADTLFSHDGADQLNGGAGHDLAQIDRSNATSDLRFLLADLDAVTTLVGDGTQVTLVEQFEIRGGSGADLISLGAGADTLHGGSGSDTLIGGGGHDLIDGDTGDDVVVYGGLRADYVVTALAAGGFTVRDRRAGSPDGSDTLIGVEDLRFADSDLELVRRPTSGPDILIGVDRADSIEGLDGSDKLRGLGGDDTLAGNAGDDTLEGGTDDDLLDGGTGADILVGGPGHDTYIVDDARDRVRELPLGGADTVLASVDFTLSADVEDLVLTGGLAISGTGNSLANRVVGNAADNLLDGGGGADTMIGGAGNDLYRVDALDMVIELAGGGADTVTSTRSFSLDGMEQIEVLAFTGSTDANGVGNAGHNRIIGNSASNILTGGLGDDTLEGGSGNDVLRGGEGADRLLGGAGVDRLEGGAGNDVYVVADADSVRETADNGIDLVQASVSFVLSSHVENLTLTGAAPIDGTGNNLGNVIAGNAAANLLSGLSGSDRLNGNGGDDTLIGGTGRDTLTGGAGADIFRFATAAEAKDLVTDYAATADTIEISAGGFGGGLAAGMDLTAAGRFVSNLTGKADGAVGQFVFETDRQILWWDADGTGVGAREAVATLRDVTSLAASEIVVIA